VKGRKCLSSSWNDSTVNVEKVRENMLSVEKVQLQLPSSIRQFSRRVGSPRLLRRLPCSQVDAPLQCTILAGRTPFAWCFADVSIALDVSPFLRGLPEPTRASADHRLALTLDVLVPGPFLSCRGERFKPTLDFQVFTEAWALDECAPVNDGIVTNLAFFPDVVYCGILLRPF